MLARNGVGSDTPMLTNFDMMSTMISFDTDEMIPTNFGKKQTTISFDSSKTPIPTHFGKK